MKGFALALLCVWAGCGAFRPAAADAVLPKQKVWLVGGRWIGFDQPVDGCVCGYCAKGSTAAPDSSGDDDCPYEVVTPEAVLTANDTNPVVGGAVEFTFSDWQLTLGDDYRYAFFISQRLIAVGRSRSATVGMIPAGTSIVVAVVARWSYTVAVNDPSDRSTWIFAKSITIVARRVKDTIGVAPAEETPLVSSSRMLEELDKDTTVPNALLALDLLRSLKSGSVGSPDRVDAFSFYDALATYFAALAIRTVTRVWDRETLLSVLVLLPDVAGSWIVNAVDSPALETSAAPFTYKLNDDFSVAAQAALETNPRGLTQTLTNGGAELIFNASAGFRVASAVVASYSSWFYPNAGAAAAVHSFTVYGSEPAGAAVYPVLAVLIVNSTMVVPTPCWVYWHYYEPVSMTWQVGGTLSVEKQTYDVLDTSSDSKSEDTTREARCKIRRFTEMEFLAGTEEQDPTILAQIAKKAALFTAPATNSTWEALLKLDGFGEVLKRVSRTSAVSPNGNVDFKAELSIMLSEAANTPGFEPQPPLGIWFGRKTTREDTFKPSMFTLAPESAAPGASGASAAAAACASPRAADVFSVFVPILLATALKLGAVAFSAAGRHGAAPPAHPAENGEGHAAGAGGRRLAPPVPEEVRRVKQVSSSLVAALRESRGASEGDIAQQLAAPKAAGDTPWDAVVARMVALARAFARVDQAASPADRIGAEADGLVLPPECASFGRRSVHSAHRPPARPPVNQAHAAALFDVAKRHANSLLRHPGPKMQRSAARAVAAYHWWWAIAGSSHRRPGGLDTGDRLAAWHHVTGLAVFALFLAVQVGFEDSDTDDPPSSLVWHSVALGCGLSLVLLFPAGLLAAAYRRVVKGEDLTAAAFVSQGQIPAENAGLTRYGTPAAYCWNGRTPPAAGACPWWWADETAAAPCRPAGEHPPFAPAQGGNRSSSSNRNNTTTNAVDSNSNVNDNNNGTYISNSNNYSHNNDTANTSTSVTINGGGAAREPEDPLTVEPALSLVRVDIGRLRLPPGGGGGGEAAARLTSPDLFLEVSVRTRLGLARQWVSSTRWLASAETDWGGAARLALLVPAHADGAVLTVRVFDDNGWQARAAEHLVASCAVLLPHAVLAGECPAEVQSVFPLVRRNKRDAPPPGGHRPSDLSASDAESLASDRPGSPSSPLLPRGHITRSSFPETTNQTTNPPRVQQNPNPNPNPNPLGTGTSTTRGVGESGLPAVGCVPGLPQQVQQVQTARAAKPVAAPPPGLVEVAVDAGLVQSARTAAAPPAKGGGAWRWVAGNAVGAAGYIAVVVGLVGVAMVVPSVDAETRVGTAAVAGVIVAACVAGWHQWFRQHAAVCLAAAAACFASSVSKSSTLAVIGAAATLCAVLQPLCDRYAAHLAPPPPTPSPLHQQQQLQEEEEEEDHHPRAAGVPPFLDEYPLDGASTECSYKPPAAVAADTAPPPLAQAPAAPLALPGGGEAAGAEGLLPDGSLPAAQRGGGSHDGSGGGESARACTDILGGDADDAGDDGRSMDAASLSLSRNSLEVSAEDTTVPAAGVTALSLSKASLEAGGLSAGPPGRGFAGGRRRRGREAAGVLEARPRRGVSAHSERPAAAVVRAVPLAAFLGCLAGAGCESFGAPLWLVAAAAAAAVACGLAPAGLVAGHCARGGPGDGPGDAFCAAAVVSVSLWAGLAVVVLGLQPAFKTPAATRSRTSLELVAYPVGCWVAILCALSVYRRVTLGRVLPTALHGTAALLLHVLPGPPLTLATAVLLSVFGADWCGTRRATFVLAFFAYVAVDQMTHVFVALARVHSRQTTTVGQAVLHVFGLRDASPS